MDHGKGSGAFGSRSQWKCHRGRQNFEPEGEEEWPLGKVCFSKTGLRGTCKILHTVLCFKFDVNLLITKILAWIVLRVLQSSTIKRQKILFFDSEVPTCTTQILKRSLGDQVSHPHGKISILKLNCTHVCYVGFDKPRLIGKTLIRFNWHDVYL